MKAKTWLLIVILSVSLISVVVMAIYYFSSLFVAHPAIEDVDLFGIDKIYPTKEDGREWYVDMENPFSDDLFS